MEGKRRLQIRETFLIIESRKVSSNEFPAANLRQRRFQSRRLHKKAKEMAKCDEGYPCEVCGEDVEDITDSDLYLRYVIGLVDPETLHTSPERHLRCNPKPQNMPVSVQTHTS